MAPLPSQSSVDKLIRFALSLDSKESIPNHQQLSALFSSHLVAFPDDDNFLLSLRESDYGTVTCMEDTCFSDIPLSPNRTLRDGGKSMGVGSFAEFHKHIHTPVHTEERKRRVMVSSKLKNKINPRPPEAQPRQQHQQQQQQQRQQPIASGSNSGKRSSSPSSSTPIAKRHQPLATISNSQLLPLANYPAIHANLRKQIQIGDATLMGLRASGGSFDQIDEVQRGLFSNRAELEGLEKKWGKPRVVEEEMRGMSGADKGRLIGAAMGGNAVASGSGRLVDVIADGSGGMEMDAEFDEGLMGIRGIGGLTASTEDLDEFLRAAAEGPSFEGNHTVDDAATALGLTRQTQPVENMLIPLMPHQLIGVAWMVEREKSKHFGGIMADEMGLGKTVQTIALMAKNGSLDPAEKTTLIIAPLALLSQWKDEIVSKMEDKHWRVLIYHGKEKAGKNDKDLLKYDVVLTTYHTLANEWPDEEAAVKKAKKNKKPRKDVYGFPMPDDEDEDDFVPQLKKMGPLFKVGWFRVVLDEAQNIRNKSTKISRSVAQLDTLFRWCLTGTPVTNSLGDLYPLLRFLQIKPWFAFREFREHIMTYEKKKPDIAGKRAQTILCTCMMRRKKDSKLDGKELITLPSKTVELQVLEFSEEEREIYSFVETKSQEKFNKYLRQGTVLKNYASVLVMLLRLRQICLHPCLITDGFDQLAKGVEEEGKNADELERAEKLLGESVVNRIRKARLAVVAERCRAEKADAETGIEGDDCPICFDPLQDSKGGAVVTACTHTFCMECLDDVLVQHAPEPDANDEHGVSYKQDERPCPSCRQPISKKMLFKMTAFEPTDAEIDEITGGILVDGDVEEEKRSEDEDDAPEEDEEDLPVFIGMHKQKNRAVVVDSDDEEESNAKEMEKRKEKDEKKKAKAKARELPTFMQGQEPSTKMKWVLGEIQRIDEGFPDDKFLIISQFTSALDLVDDYLGNNGFKVTRFQGDMSADQRSLSVATLAKSKKCKIMLMSLKCGGVGLNLVRANRVINLDLGWSHAVEAQAFDRVHRIGQTKEVRVDRLTISNTVEQRISVLQENKKLLADASMGEGTGKKLGRLTVADLANLFGLRQNGERL